MIVVKAAVAYKAAYAPVGGRDHRGGHARRDGRSTRPGSPIITSPAPCIPSIDRSHANPLPPAADGRGRRRRRAEVRGPLGLLPAQPAGRQERRRPGPAARAFRQGRVQRGSSWPITSSTSSTGCPTSTSRTSSDVKKAAAEQPASRSSRPSSRSATATACSPTTRTWPRGCRSRTPRSSSAGRTLGPAGEPVRLANGDLEEAEGRPLRRVQLPGRAGQGDVRRPRTVHHGGASCRMQDAGTPAGNCRLIQRVKVRPHACYRFSCWVKTRGPEAGRRVQAAGDRGEPGAGALTFHEGA